MRPFFHDFPFDPTYGCDLTALLAIEPPAGPADLADFWATTCEEARRVAPRPELRPCKTSRPNGKVFEVTFSSWRERQVGGWVIEPLDRDPERAIVVGHGYGGRESPELELPFARRSVQIYPCAPGFHRSPAARVPHNQAAFHVIHGIGQRDSYLIRDCVASLWCTVSAVLALYPEVREVAYYGESFGGGLGALALPWDARIKRAILGVPTFGHHPRRLQCPCQGSGEAVRSYARHRGDVLPVLQYYDAATVALETQIPVLTMPALFDPAVPPPGQFAVANALRAPGSELCIRRAGHFGEYPGYHDDQQRCLAACRRFLAGW